jgi:predicted DNA-binding transcriptional regulator AlpA
MPRKLPRHEFIHDPDSLMSVQQVCAFFGNVSKMSPYRWSRNPASGFPRPFKVGQKNYWVRREIIKYRDSQKARSQVEPTGAPPPQATGDTGVP